MLSLIFTKYFCRNRGGNYVELWYRGYPVGLRDVTNRPLFAGDAGERIAGEEGLSDSSSYSSLLVCFQFIVPWPNRMNISETKMHLPRETQASWHGICYSIKSKFRERKISACVKNQLSLRDRLLREMLCLEEQGVSLSRACPTTPERVKLEQV